MHCAELHVISPVHGIGSGGHTVQAGLDHIQRMDSECRKGAACEPGNGLNMRRGDARMVFSHVGELWFIIM